MTITRVGSTTKYADGWETAFGKTKKKAKATSPKKEAAKPKAAAKKAVKRATSAKKKAKR